MRSCCLICIVFPFCKMKDILEIDGSVTGTKAINVLKLMSCM